MRLFLRFLFGLGLCKGIDDGGIEQLLAFAFAKEQIGLDPPAGLDIGLEPDIADQAVIDGIDLASERVANRLGIVGPILRLFVIGRKNLQLDFRIRVAGIGAGALDRDLAGAQRIQDFRRQRSEAQPLTDIIFRAAEAASAIGDAGGGIVDISPAVGPGTAGSDDSGESLYLVRRVHGDLLQIFGKAGLEPVVSGDDMTGNRVIVGDAPEFHVALERAVAAAAGIDGIFAVLAGRARSRRDDQIL